MTHQVQRDGVMTFIKEVDINQIWLLGHSPWVNANKKPNGKWINNITKEEIQVQVGSPSHKCVIYQNYVSFFILLKKGTFIHTN